MTSRSSRNGSFRERKGVEDERKMKRRECGVSSFLLLFVPSLPSGFKESTETGPDSVRLARLLLLIRRPLLRGCVAGLDICQACLASVSVC
jgi:hypothetical protein